MKTMVLALTFLAAMLLLTAPALATASIYTLKGDGTTVPPDPDNRIYSFTVNAKQLDDLGNAKGHLTYTVTDRTTGEVVFSDKMKITAMNADSNNVWVGGPSADLPNVGNSLELLDSPDGDAAGILNSFTPGTQSDILSVVNSEYPSMMNPLTSGYVEIKLTKTKIDIE